MRLSAYKKALEQARLLPGSIPELKEYFGDCYSPREEAMIYIMNRARKDSELLFHGEFIELYEERRKYETL
jgi:hypothetical protein